jgi:hypothetical protein
MLSSYAILAVTVAARRFKKNNGSLRSDRNHLLFLSVKELVVFIGAKNEDSTVQRADKLLEDSKCFSVLIFIILTGHMLISKMYW